MARGINKAILVGNLGKDPEVKYTTSGQSVTSFTLATTRSYKDKNGEWKEETDWHNIKAWGKTGESVAQYLNKGRQVYIEGRIQSRTWEDNDGKKHYFTDIVADIILLLGGRGEGGGSSDRGGRTMEPVRGSTPSAEEGSQETGAPEITDDDIPF